MDSKAITSGAVMQPISTQERNAQIKQLVKEANDLFNAGNYEAALKLYKEGDELLPNQACLDGIASYYMLVCDWDNAISKYQESIAKYNGPKAYSRLAYIYYNLGKIDQSIEVASRGIAVSPAGKYDASMARFYRACAYLRQGNYAAGFADYEAREIFAPKTGIPNLKPLPLNTAITGKKILILSEQGHGDSIQFIRYAKKLIASGAQVSFYVDANLYSLFVHQIPGLKLVSAVDGKFDLGAFDYTVRLLSLPFYFGTEKHSIPASDKYLTPDAQLVEEWADILGEKRKPRIGICWAGGHRPDNRDAAYIDQMRSIPFDAFGAIVEAYADRFEFISLQKGEDAVKQMEQSHQGRLVIDRSERLHSFMHTAALIENMDLVITVDTAVAHLAGAIGKPTLLLSRYNACWRWLAGQEMTPWYPSMRVLLQERMGDWDSVLQGVRTHLEGIAAVPAKRVV